MLRRLLIENYGLIERAEIAFSDGATMFTGETGSGKTMLLGALGFVLGDRATVDAVRRGATRANVSLTFEPSSHLRARFHSDGFPVEPGKDAAVTRDITSTGKSSMRLNGRPATASYLREIAGDIVDAVGQHDAQRLLTPAYHVEVLDRFAGEKTLAARENVRHVYDEFHRITERLAALEGDDRRARAAYDDARYAIEEIDAAHIQAGEDERLTKCRRFLDNVERIAAAVQTAHDALAGEQRASETGASSALGVATAALHGIAGLSPDFSELADRVARLQEEAQDLSTELARALEATEFNPNELEQINDRLNALDRLKRKYGENLDAVVLHAEKARQLIADFDGRDERLIELHQQREEKEEQLQRLADELSAMRHAAAKKLVKAVTGEFADLALTSGRFDVVFEPSATVSPNGHEEIEFVFAANAGEPLRPLARVASGGELSRVLLALAVVSTHNDTATFVFDEIDTGIGGATATAVGARFGRLAQTNQVICVTHLAQIANWAKKHYILEKIEKKTGTTIGVRELAGINDREAELARMLSGETHEVAIKHARTLLRRVQA